VGYVTGWQPAPFTFTVINQSAVRTCVRLVRVPAIFEMRAPTAAEELAAEIAGDRSLLLWLAPFQTRSVECSLTAAMLLTGTALEMRQTRAWHLEVSNVYNPANVGTLRITAKVTLLRLRYAGLRWHERHRSTDDPRSASGSVALTTALEHAPELRLPRLQHAHARHLAGQHAGVRGRAQGDRQHGIYGAPRVHAEEIAHELAHLRGNPRR